MKIETKRFGTITVSEDEQFDVPHGIPGFRKMRRVVLFGAGPVSDHDPEPSDHIMFWMQDLDDGDLAFLCTVPWALFPGYDLEIDEQELGIIDDGDVRVLNLVTVHRSGHGASMTANLRAPILVDIRRRRLHQVILADTRWAVNEPVGAATSTGGI